MGRDAADAVGRAPAPSGKGVAATATTGAFAIALLLLTAGCLGALDGGDLAGGADDLLPTPAVLHDQRLGPAGQSAMEVSIAADQTDPAHLVAASNLRAEGHSGFGVYVSWDAGGSWTFDHFDPEDAGTTLLGQPRFTRLSDPVVAVGPDGTVYLSGLGVLPTSAIFLAVSEDGGETWPEVHLVEESDPVTDFNDKEWFAVSPTTGTIIMAWQKEPAIDMLRGVEYQTGLDVDIGNVVVSRSTDGGVSWSDPVEVDRGMHNNGTQVAFTPDGTAHLVWVNYEQGTLDHVHSTDDGETWSDPVAVAEVHVVPPYDDYQRMHTLPGLAAGPDGELVAVWHDRRHGDADVYLVASARDGTERIWNTPTRVNQDAIGNGALQLYPWVAIGPDGRVHVSYYSQTNGSSRDDPRLEYVHTWAGPVDVEVLGGEDCRREGPATICDGRMLQWTGTLAHAATPVSEPFAFFGRNGILGDYTGIVATEAGVVPAWADGRTETVGIHAARVVMEG